MSNFKKIFGLAGSVMVFTGLAYGQTPGPVTCNTPVANANLIRAEGTTELAGNLSFTCTGTATNVSILVFSSLPVTSKALTTGTEASLIGPGGVLVATGVVSGNQITFSGVSIAAATYTITNVRVNATSLTVGTGTPPPVSESVFISGATISSSVLAATPVAYVLPGLTGIKATGIANQAACAATSPSTAAFSVSFTENFPTAFKVQGTSNPLLTDPFFNNTETGYTGSGITGNVANSGTRVKIVFANIPTGATIYVPTTVSFSSGTPAAVVGTLTLTASETGAFSPLPASTTSGAPAGTAALTAVSGSATAVYEVTLQSIAGQETYSVPVYFSAAAGSVTATAAVTASVSLAPTGSTNIPNFAPTTATPVTGAGFSLCSTSLLFPFVTNQLGFDTGIAISNTSTDPFGTTGAKPSAGTCTWNFYGSGAPSPATGTSPSVPSGTTYTAVLSNVAPGFQGYIIPSATSSMPMASRSSRLALEQPVELRKATWR